MFGALSVPGSRILTPDRLRILLIVGAVLLGSLALGILVITGRERLAIAVGVATPMLALAVLNIRVAIAMMMVYLIFLGDVRRMLIPLVGWSGLDPLLLLGGALAILVCTYAVVSRAIQLDTPLSKWMAALMVVMILQMFNPSQGGLIVGVGGAMFLLIPLFWFWIGRTYGTEAFMNTILYKIVVPLSIPAAALGLYQVFYGYLPYQLTWYDVAGYAALGSRENPAPVSLFASGTEYGVYLSITIVVLWSLVMCKKQRVFLVLVAILFVAIFLTGSRGPVAKTLITCAALWAVMGQNAGTWVARGILALLIAGAGMFWSLSKVGSIEGSPVQGKIDRQVQGLMNPTDSEKSSVGLHLFMMVEGYERVVRNPIGLGLGSTTRAAQKFGSNAQSTEVDLGNMLVSTGLVGGFMYHAVVFLILLTAVRYWKRTRSPLAMAFMGILAVTFFGWLRGGGYAVDPIVWICAGALDRLQNQRIDDGAVDDA